MMNKDYHKLDYLYDNLLKENQVYNKYIYNEYKDHVTITFYEGREEVVVIPEYINGKKVYSIDDSAFYGNDKIKKVIIPKYVIRIGHQAFIGSNNLKEVVLSDNIIDIGDFAFDVCPKLEKIIVKKNSKSDKSLEYTKFYKYVFYSN